LACPPDCDRRRDRSSRLLGAWLALSMLAIGCSQELGPERFRTTAISGRLTMAGRPLGPGWLEMMPVDGTTGRLRSVRVERDGSFRADQVPVGELAMRMVGFPPVGTGVSAYDEFLRDVRQVYLIRRRVGPEGGALVLELSQDVRGRLAGAP
jgi:hypothetical protein